jgi:hypothetical protein
LTSVSCASSSSLSGSIHWIFISSSAIIPASLVSLSVIFHLAVLVFSKSFVVISEIVSCLSSIFSAPAPVVDNSNSNIVAASLELPHAPSNVLVPTPSHDPACVIGVTAQIIWMFPAST